MSGERLTGVELIAVERARQLVKEGWTFEHDDEHTAAELLTAADCYLYAVYGEVRYANFDRDDYATMHWPWDRDSWKPSDDPIRNLVKAGALIAAEIDRLQRDRCR